MSLALDTVATPAALVDLPRLKRNTERMSDRAQRLGVQLRPHVKTHKCVEAAKYQVAGHFGGITVSTLAEAATFGSAGFEDVTYAVPLSPGRAARAQELSETLAHLHLLVDHMDAVEALGARALARGHTQSVLIKVDCGYGRAGVTPEDPQLLALARKISDHPFLRFQGILTHGGHSYDCRGVEEILAVARQERAAILESAQRLTEASLAVHTISVGSTPTMAVVDHLDGVTEMRPGNYALFDRVQAMIGSCTMDDVALAVLTEVIGVYPERNTMLIDAGALALSKDAGAQHVSKGTSFGAVCDLDRKRIPDLEIVGLSQEHGKIHGTSLEKFSIGDRLLILPNHSCLVTALYERLHVWDGRKITDSWQPARGWA